MPQTLSHSASENSWYQQTLILKTPSYLCQAPKITDHAAINSIPSHTKCLALYVFSKYANYAWN